MSLRAIISQSGGLVEENGITNLSGDVLADGPGSVVATLATVNSNVGSFTNANITVNAKGLVTAASNGSGGTGTVTSVSVASANGFAGSVATSTTTPAITLSTTVTGILKGNGTAISAATAGVDYPAPVTGGGSTIVTSNLTVNRALASDASGKVVVATATDTELNYLSGVTNPIQGQFNACIAAMGTFDSNGGLAAAGGSIVSQSLILQSAGTSAPGLVNTGAQSFTGKKTWMAPTTSNATMVFPTGSAPTSPVTGDVWHSSTQKVFFNFTNGISGALPNVTFVATASATLANTSAETSLVSTGSGTKTQPANYFVIAKTGFARCRGIISTALATTATFKVKLGSNIMASTGAFTMPVGLSNSAFVIDIDITCRTTGASGTFMAAGTVTITQASGTAIVLPLINSSTVTMSTSASLAFDVTGTFSVADAGNTMTGQTMVINQNY